MKISKISAICIACGLAGFGNIFAATDNIEISEKTRSKIFSNNEDLIIRGVSVPSKEIIIFWDNMVGLTESDENGSWAIDIGPVSEGGHNFQVITDNSDTTRSVATAHIVVDNTKNSLLKNFTAAILRILPFKSAEKVKLYPR